MLRLVSFLCIIAGVAFYTLAERKLLSYAQTRVGPNKVRVLGLLQPIADALKLLTKNFFAPLISNVLVFTLSPRLSLVLAIGAYLLISDIQLRGRCQPTIIWFLFILALGVFPATLAGWASNSPYARVGGYRRLRQTISYEVALFLLLLIPLRAFETLNLKGVWFPISRFLLVFVAFSLVVILAETNRAPFDLSEGERELVSGFNIEYGGAGFTLFFLAEYARIIILSL